MLAPWKESYDQPRQYIQKQRHYFIDLSPNSKSYDNPRQCIKKQRHYFAGKGPSSQGYVFSYKHIWT